MKKLVSLLVVLAMLLTMAPAVFAEEADDGLQTLVLGENTAVYDAETETPAYFMWEATGNGNLILAFDEEGRSPYVYVAEGTVYNTIWQSDVNDPEFTITVPVEEGSIYIITVEDYDEETATLYFTASFQAATGADMEGSGTYGDPWVLTSLDTINGSFTEEEAANEEFEGHYYVYEVTEAGTYSVTTGQIMIWRDAIVWGSQLDNIYEGFSVDVGDVLYINCYGYSAGAYSYTFTFTAGEGGEGGGEDEAPLGTMENPDTLYEDYYQITTDYDGYVYQWKATEATLFVLAMNGDNWSYAFVLDRADGTQFVSDTYTGMDEDQVLHMAVVEVVEGDVITLKIGTAVRGTAQVGFSAGTCMGGEETPLEPTFVWNERYTVASVNMLVLSSGAYVRGMNGMNMTINGEDCGLQSYTTATLVEGDAVEAQVWSVVCTYPVGSKENMYVVDPAGEELIAEVKAASYGMYTGYYYVYHATASGKLTITVGDEENATWYYTVKGSGVFNSYGSLTTLSFDSTKHTEENPLNAYSIDVKEGCSIIVWVCSAGKYKAAPAANIPVTFEFDGLGDVNGDGKITSRDVTRVMQYITQKLTDEDLNAAAADVNGDGKVTSRDVTAIMRYITKKITRFPVDDVKSTGELELGANELSAGGAGEYAKVKYTYTAEKAGTVYFTMRSCYMEGSDMKQYHDYFESLHQIMLGINGEFINKDYTYSVEVEAGQEIEVMLYAPQGDAMDIVLHISEDGFYTAQEGDREKPIYLYPNELPVDAVVPAEGEAWFLLFVDYYDTASYVGGNLLFVGENLSGNVVYYDETTGTFTYEPFAAVDGVVRIPVTEGIVNGIHMIQICNSGAEDSDVVVKSEYPVGHSTNPETLVLNKTYEMTLGEDASHYFTWTAEEDGKLILNVTGDYWKVSVNGAEFCVAAGATSPVSMVLYAGDTAVIELSTSDGNAYYPFGPGGAVTLLAEFKVGDTSCDHSSASAILDFDAMTITKVCNGCGKETGPYNLYGGEPVTVAAGETVYLWLTEIATVTATDGNGAVVETVECENVTVDTGMGMPTTITIFSITNNSDAEATYTVTLTCPEY